MTEATKQRLKQWIKDPFICDLLENVGILYPAQIAEASNDELARAGLTVDEIAELRAQPKIASILRMQESLA